MEYVGGLSGGALGFIAGNVGGAVTGASLGYSAGKNFNSNSKMARGRSLTRQQPIVIVPASRSRSRPKYIRRRRSISSSLPRKRGVYHVYNRNKRFKKKRVSFQPTLRKAGYQKKRKSVTKYRGKRVKISKRFRRKVLKVITGSKYKGFFQYNSYSAHVASLGIGSQHVFQHTSMVVKDQQNADPSLAYPLFSPSVFQAVAETLYGNNNGPAYSTADYVMPCGGMQDTFIMATAKIPVLNSWAKYCIKNNANFGIELKMFVCRPKVKSYFYRGFPPTGDLVSDQDYVVDPVVDFQRGLEVLRGEVSNPANVVIRLPQLKGQCVADATDYDDIRAYGIDPRSLPHFNKYWACDVHKFKIMPGQCIEKIVKGPKDVLIDMSKLWNNKITNNGGGQVSWRPGGWSFEEVQKYNRYVFFIANPEMSVLVPPAANEALHVPKAGRIPFINQKSTGEVLAVEQKFYCKIGLPEEVGRRNEAAFEAGDFIRENQKRDVYFLMNQIPISGVVPTGTIYRNTQNSGIVDFQVSQP